jgi:hypothetical protein
MGCAVGFQQGYGTWKHLAIVIIIGLLGCDMGCTGGTSRYLIRCGGQNLVSSTLRLWLTVAHYGPAHAALPDSLIRARKAR